jgi:hypothetical protein
MIRIYFLIVVVDNRSHSILTLCFVQAPYNCQNRNLDMSEFVLRSAPLLLLLSLALEQTLTWVVVMGALVYLWDVLQVLLVVHLIVWTTNLHYSLT